MYLNKTTADKIIQEISKVVDHHINIINNNGFVIASTDLLRVNNFHEAAHIVIRNNYQELIVEYDEQYEGCMTGVNLPIYFSKEIIGVVGITGNPEIVGKYARIIQKMTEMVIYEYFNLWNRNYEEQLKLVFTNDLINGNFFSSLFEIEEGLHKNNLDVKGKYTVALIKYVQGNDVRSNSQLNTARHNIIKQYITNKISYRKSLVSYNGKFFIIISNLILEELNKEMEYLCKKVKEIHRVPLLCSIGNTYDSYENISKSYNEAVSVSNLIGNETGIYQFNKISLNVALSKIPENYKSTLKGQVFSQCSRKEMQEFTDFIKSYFSCNGSLKLLSNKYYVHKNTVQYKIQKIKEKTGYDLRTYKDMFILYLASIL